VNTLEKEITIDPPHVKLEEIEKECDDDVQIFSSSEVETNDRLPKLRAQLRTDHISDEERQSLVKICEEFSDTFLFNR
jgi:predicted RNA binding protein with dsRBD fold (UPF0201 family)